MKIAIFTDIHGNEEALDAILEDCERKGIKDIYSLGDILGIGPSSYECMKKIIDNKVNNCLGNHELYCIYGTDGFNYLTSDELKHHTWVLETIPDELREDIKKMPMKFDLNINSKILRLCHFPIDPKNNKFYSLALYRKFGPVCFERGSEEYDKLIFGHNHFSRLNSKKYVNLNSSGCIYNNMTSYAIFDTDTFSYEIVKVPFDREKLVKKLKGYPNFNHYLSYFGL